MRYTSDDALNLFKKLNIDQNSVSMTEFLKGVQVETEHGLKNPKTNVTDDDPTMTAKIALAHLLEIPDYYTRLDKMEKEGKAAKANIQKAKMQEAAIDDLLQMFKSRR